MSSLNNIDKRYLEKILGMGDGYVLDFSDPIFGEFFSRHKIDIHGTKYQTYGTSKAKKLRAFWEKEADDTVHPVLNEMLASYEADCELNGKNVDEPLLKKAKIIVGSLGGKTTTQMPITDNINEFLNHEFSIPNIHKLPIENQVAVIISSRLSEARVALNAKAYLSVIFLCGSVLEGVLLGVAQKNPKMFNQSKVSPKDAEGKVKPFHDWSLSHLIDAACDIGFLKPDVQKFGHGLRDFRNYIHPYQQMVSGFTPDEHTAKVCFQVLKAALASLAGERG